MNTRLAAAASFLGQNNRFLQMVERDSVGRIYLNDHPSCTLAQPANFCWSSCTKQDYYFWGTTFILDPAEIYTLIFGRDFETLRSVVVSPYIFFCKKKTYYFAEAFSPTEKHLYKKNVMEPRLRTIIFSVDKMLLICSQRWCLHVVFFFLAKKKYCW